MRAGRDDDAEGFIALIDACWAEYPGCVMDLDGEVPELRALASYYAGQDGALWAAEVAGRVVGMVATRPLRDGEESWEICKMYAAREMRGGGLAHALIEAAEAHARTQGAQRMKLWTDTRFDRAHRFYEKRSYVRSGPIRALNDKSNSIEFAYTKPLAGVHVERLDAAGAASAEGCLALILKECVDNDASVSFLPPLVLDKAAAFWRRMAADVAGGRRVLLAAWVDGLLAGIVMLDLDMPENQPHRADLQKLLVRPGIRRRGVGRLLMERIEQEARDEGRRLLVLDTRAGDAAEPLYRGMGWQEAGRIPGFAVNADGTLGDTVYFWKNVG
nr:GNAT family N-acetyltransferase [Limobrevibacterium gyesilva]